jgi:hypothetical protein
MDVLVESQHRRQRILDFLNATAEAAAADPGGDTPASATVPQITAGTGDPHKSITGTLALMRERHEVASTGKKLAVRYVAMVTTTIDAQTMYDAIREHAGVKAKRASTEVNEAAKRAKTEPWRTVHKGGENPAIKAQGGQGSLRRTVYVNCQQNY